MGRRMRAVLVAAGVAGLLTVAGPGSASACSCMTPVLADQLVSPEIVAAFTGTPDRVDVPTGPGSRSDEHETWAFAVDAVHKGTVGRTTEVSTAVSSSSCGVEFRADRPGHRPLRRP
ncbi:MAG: hypothetical protein ABJA16_02725 [Nakamurella sp.]